MMQKDPELIVLGVPANSPGRSSEPSLVTNQPALHDYAPHQHETLGAPRGIEHGVPLGPADHDLFQQRDEAQRQSEYEEEVIATHPAWSPTAAAVLVVLGGLCLLVLLSQALSLWGTLSSLPAPARWIGFAAVTTLSIAVLLTMVYLGIGYVKLAVSPRVSLRSLRELDERTKTRAAAQRQSALATSRIEQFLAAYPLDARGLEQLKRLGAESDQLLQLTKSRERLLREHQSLSGGANWLHDVDKDFLRMLDNIASRRIKLTAKKVGIATAAAPTGFIDSGIVAVNGFLLVGDLCRIYNLRSDRWSTILILGHVLINLFAAGNMEGVTEGVGDGVADTVADSAGFGIAAAAGLASARVAEGTANGLLTWRLGSVAMRRLRPIGL